MVREFVAEGAKALKFLHGPAIHALALGLVAEEHGPAVGLAGEVFKAMSQGEVAVLEIGRASCRERV